jgi:pyruvate dehydrogenase E2 component (dihydrolipoyllysine-residue acetyltransferase)
MPIPILMPALSPTMEKGNLAKWLKKEGDSVKAGDVIAEIETDKATMEVEASDEGVLAKIFVPEGTQDVPVNQPIAVLAGEGEDPRSVAASDAEEAASKPQQPPPPAKPSPQPAEPAGAPAAGAAVERPSPAPQPRPQPAPPSRAQPQPPSAARRINGGTARTFSSPLARRLAKEAGIDIGAVQGTGPHGRVIARDVEAAKSGAGLRAPPAARAPAVPTAPGARAPAEDKIRALFEPGTYEVVPLDNMRKIIAQRLTESKLSIPHFYLTIDCDLDKLLAARQEINQAAPKDREGKPSYKISVNDFVIKSLALALQKVPDANVTWTENALLKHKHSDVGVAVAIPGGLITPVVRRAETKSLSVISNEMKDFAARARQRRLKPEEYQGGSTAVSNLGMYGIKDFAAVINPPHATILAVGAAEERPVVRDGTVTTAKQMTVTLSTDHRAVDGALGAELLGAFKKFIENPVMMLA